MTGSAPTADTPAPFALLDDGAAAEGLAASRLYTGFRHEHTCTDPATLDATWAALQADLAQGRHAVLLADYEWCARLIGAAHAPPDPRDDPPALRLLVFERLQRLDGAGVSAWLAAQPGADDAAGPFPLRASVDDAGFDAAIADILGAIAAGETYQVNYTQRLIGAAYGPPLALYRRLRARQPVPHGALIRLPAGPGRRRSWVLSRSPELFVQVQGGQATARPMKGTARRAAEPVGDSETARELAHDAKNRAENLMIVDLLRNDLGRVARVGSVRVPELFRIEPYATVFQMTSTVQAQLAEGIGAPALLRALAPCGSITGAPKRHTMGLIARLEGSPRGLYCGAIGWVDAAPPGQACEDLCLSVAIRTLTLGAPIAAGADGADPLGRTPPGAWPLKLGVGSGIVADSVAADERAECRLKARFLTGLEPPFQLFETLLAEPMLGVARLEAHLERLQRSAAALGMPCDIGQARRLLLAAAAEVRQPTRLRLSLAAPGRLVLAQAALAPLLPWPGTPEAQAGRAVGAAGAPVGLLVAPHRLAPGDPLAAHKTTRRAAYDAGVRAAEAVGAFDSLFFRSDGRLVEGGRSNVFLYLDGCWWTPPVADGALPGVVRAELLEDRWVDARERTLTRVDLDRAQAIWVCNALRGVLAAVVVDG